MALLGRLTRLESLARKRPAATNQALEAIRADRAAVFPLAGMKADPWQMDLLRSLADRVLLLASRQVGKSTSTACLALATALTKPGSTTLLFSPSLRQSGELYKKVVDGFNRLGRPLAVVRETATELVLGNASRIVSLPGSASTVRGYSAPDLVVVDESAYVADDLFAACAPMLATSGGKLVLLTTPAGKRGIFWSMWSDGGPEWQRISVRADQCPRIGAAFLAEQRKSLGERWFRQEFCCSFEDVIGCLFSEEDLDAAMRADITPLFGEP